MMAISGQGIHHLRVAHAGTITDILLSQGFPRDRIEKWFYMGAIYLDGKRFRTDTSLNRDQVLRVHTQPKHYNWEPGPLRERIVFDDPEFLVLDKPAGLPVHATLDNYVDNAKFLLEQELGYTLYSTHRLDIPTTGLLILAKSKAAQVILNKTFAKRRIQKIYQAGTVGPVPLGEHVLYLNPSSRVPREYSPTPVMGWWECRLKILASEFNQSIFINRIELITGRTHQIRAQLAAMGTPILGDKLYGSDQEYVPERLALECESLSLTFRSRTLAFKRPRSLFSAVPHS